MAVNDYELGTTNNAFLVLITYLYLRVVSRDVVRHHFTQGKDSIYCLIPVSKNLDPGSGLL